MQDLHGTPGVVVRVLGPICVVLAGLSGVTACYSPDQPDCGFICGPGGACPDNYFCNGLGQCQRNGTAAAACNAIDSGVTFDQGEGLDGPADADVTPPVVSSVFPELGTTVSDHLANIYVYFSEGVANVNASSFQVTIGGNQVAGTINPAGLETTSSWLFYPAAQYPSNVEVDIALTDGIYDYAGNRLAAAPVMSHFFIGP